eukprot:CAMPEP_0206139960 /NCGR_PEP_ID=MMETSP1473-20131121/7831_1 /ASSEMBLY_ACC=CAM_ASM_001109 /TAXON_ID=1461547 /ORGANISM="Stichococcus sp, Strain RCC1054" /LENGTH=576 /DNA_ID=CAMNT_0053533915 /DNA_START=228 /DNA_END=1955 /DNA_ORIENTATION=+
MTSAAPSAPHPALAALLDGEQWGGTPPAAGSEGEAAASSSAALEAEHTARLQAEADARHATQRLAVAQQQIAEYAEGRAEEARALANDSGKLQELLSQILSRLPIGEVGAAAAATSAEATAAPGAEPALDGGSAAGITTRSRSCGAAAEASPLGSSVADDVSSAAAAQDLAATLEALRTRLAEAASEASAFAQLQQSASEPERLKRNSTQAGMDEDGDGGSAPEDSKRQRSGDSSGESDSEGEVAEGMEADGLGATAVTAGRHSLTERAQWIPLRLDADERRLLRLLEAALSVSEYTDKVDILSWKSKNSRVHAQIKDICAILCGLVIAQDYRKGQKMVAERNFQDNATFFQNVFEVGRRFRIMNPDRMRSTYGLLMYMLMDSAEPSIQELLEFQCVRPLRTVYARLEEGGALPMLADPLAEKATAEIKSAGRPRHEIQRDIRAKERARDALAKRYSRGSRLSEEELLQCLYSIADNNSFLLYNRDPIDRMLQLLRDNFRPDGFDSEAGSLAISMGRGGARLTHSHQKQYTYVSQSLTLWREIHEAMFELWCHTDGDLLSAGNSYRLSNTGQGLNR